MIASRWTARCWAALLALGLALPASPACQGTDPGETPEPVERPAAVGAGGRVLLVGNSLTAGNDLAGMLEALADSAGLDWQVAAEVAGGASLEDLWAGTTTRELIRDGRWDAVVLQQGPSALPASRAHLRHWAGVFDEAIREAGARTGLYMVWPDLVRPGDFDRVRDSYALAAADVGGWFLPAGESWRAAWRRDPAAALYGLDGFHPTPEGTYLAALTLFAGLSDRTPVGLPATLSAQSGGTLVSVPPPLVDLLQAAAAEAVAQYRDYRPEDRP
ncbi:MAG TPA: SGNH/GDSL hydrolase family protein [Gemmatimonadales bacterium]